MDTDGFTIVKRGGRQKTFKRTTVLASLEVPDVEVDFEKERGKGLKIRLSRFFDSISTGLKLLERQIFIKMKCRSYETYFVKGTLHEI